MGDVLDGALLRLILTYDMPESQEAQNVLGLGMTGGQATDAQFLTACATWVNGAYGTLQGIMHNNVDLYEGKVIKVIWSGTAWITDRLIGTLFPTFTATDGTDMLPHAVSGVVTMPTIVPKKRGRINIPGITEANQGDSLLGAGAATAMANFATAIRTPFSAGTGTVYYTILGKGGASHTSTGYSLPGVVGSQRRRKPGLGI